MEKLILYSTTLNHQVVGWMHTEKKPKHILHYSVRHGYWRPPHLLYVILYISTGHTAAQFMYLLHTTHCTIGHGLQEHSYTIIQQLKDMREWLRCWLRWSDPVDFQGRQRMTVQCANSSCLWSVTVLWVQL